MVVTSEAVRFAPSQVVASLQVPFPNPCSAKCQTCTELSFPVVVTQAVLDLSPLVAVLTAPRGRCLPPWGGGADSAVCQLYYWRHGSVARNLWTKIVAPG